VTGDLQEKTSVPITINLSICLFIVH